MECVAACMSSLCDGDEAECDRWTVTGLLHDFDYEKHPTHEEHPFKGVKHLQEHTDADEDIIQAILGHATYSGVARESQMAKTLFAVDELSELLI